MRSWRRRAKQIIWSRVLCLAKTSNILRYNICLHRFVDGRSTVRIYISQLPVKRTTNIPNCLKQATAAISQAHEKKPLLRTINTFQFEEILGVRRILFLFSNSVGKYRVTNNLCLWRHILLFSYQSHKKLSTSFPAYADISETKRPRRDFLRYKWIGSGGDISHLVNSFEMFLTFNPTHFRVWLSTYGDRVSTELSMIMTLANDTTFTSRYQR